MLLTNAKQTENYKAVQAQYPCCPENFNRYIIVEKYHTNRKVGSILFTKYFETIKLYGLLQFPM